MKTKFKFPVFVVTVLLLAMGSLLIQGCEPEPIPGPPPIQPKVELTVAPSGILPYGAYCTVTWSSTDAKTLTLNNKQTTLSGSVTNRLFRDTIFEVVARNESLSAKAEKEVKVGDWTTSKFGLVSYYPWTFKEFRVILVKDSSIVYREEPTAEEKAKRFYYHRNGDLVTNFLAFTGKWSISEDGKFLIRDGNSEKFSVSEKELITYQETTWYDKPALFLNVFEHASTTPTGK